MLRTADDQNLPATTVSTAVPAILATSRPSEVEKYKDTTEPELLESSGGFRDVVGETQPPGIEKYRGTTEPDLAVSSGLRGPMQIAQRCRYTSRKV